MFSHDLCKQWGMELSNQEFEPWAKINLPSFIKLFCYFITATESWLAISTQLQIVSCSAILLQCSIPPLLYSITLCGSQPLPTERATDLHIAQSPFPTEASFPVTTLSPALTVQQCQVLPQHVLLSPFCAIVCAVTSAGSTSSLALGTTVTPSVTSDCDLCRLPYRNVSAVLWVPLPSSSHDLVAIITLPAVFYLCIFVLSFLKKFKLFYGRRDRQNYTMELWFLTSGIHMPSPSCSVMNITPAVKKFYMWN